VKLARQRIENARPRRIVPKHRILVRQAMESDAGGTQKCKPAVSGPVSHRGHHLAFRPVRVKRVIPVLPFGRENRVQHRQCPSQSSECGDVGKFAEIACGDHRLCTLNEYREPLSKNHLSTRAAVITLIVRTSPGLSFGSSHFEVFASEPMPARASFLRFRNRSRR